MRAPSRTHARAKTLRSKLSLPEVLLWIRLRRRTPGKPNFRRQHPVGPYVRDFYCSEAKLCVEIDGQSHGMGDRPQRDAERDAYLKSIGIRVVRYAAIDVLREVDEIAYSIVQTALAPPQSSDLIGPLTAPPFHGGAS
jgi:very-short-patch-repair endonuclease